jgi:hypothetical protein
MGSIGLGNYQGSRSDLKRLVSEGDSEIESSDDEDPIIIRMLDSMLPKNT